VVKKLSKRPPPTEPVLFVAKNKALGLFFVNWIVRQLQKKLTFLAVEHLVTRLLRVLHSGASGQAESALGETDFAPAFGLAATDACVELRQTPLASYSGVYSAVIVDEAHHLFSPLSQPKDRERVLKLCASVPQCLLLSDVSQRATGAATHFPPEYVLVSLEEVVRNSSRIVAASLPFSQTETLANIRCEHGW
jgi:hypothetical protein